MKTRNFDETREKIISAAARLFIQNGWEKISIQNIVDEVGDITRGAFYHHFKTKNDLIEAVTIELFDDKDLTKLTKTLFNDKDNALDKFRDILRYTLTTPSKYGLMASLEHLVKTPEFLFKLYEDGKKYSTPQIEQLILEGNKDGSMNVLYPTAAAEALTVLYKFWLTLDISDISKESYCDKIELLETISKSVGVNVVDESLKQDLINIYDLVNKK